MPDVDEQMTQLDRFEKGEYDVEVYGIREKPVQEDGELRIRSTYTMIVYTPRDGPLFEGQRASVPEFDLPSDVTVKEQEKTERWLRQWAREAVDEAVGHDPGCLSDVEIVDGFQSYMEQQNTTTSGYKILASFFEENVDIHRDLNGDLVIERYEGGKESVPAGSIGLGEEGALRDMFEHRFQAGRTDVVEGQVEPDTETVDCPVGDCNAEAVSVKGLRDHCLDEHGFWKAEFQEPFDRRETEYVEVLK